MNGERERVITADEERVKCGENMGSRMTVRDKKVRTGRREKYSESRVREWKE